MAKLHMLLLDISEVSGTIFTSFFCRYFLSQEF